MKRTLLALILLTLNHAHAAEAAPKIFKGDWEVGGAFNLSHTTELSPYYGPREKTFLTIDAAAQYFLADALSVGLDAGYATRGSRGENLSLAPVLTKYIWVEDKLAPYVSMLPIRITKADGVPAELSTSVRVGAKFFLNDNVAVGPAVDYTHDWGRDENPERSTFSFLGLFSIHL